MYGRTAQTPQEVLEQGLWLKEKLHAIFQKRNNENFQYTLLADLSKLHAINLDEAAQKLYKEIIDLPTIGKIAIVGDGFSLTSIMPLLLSVAQKEKVKFFFKIIEAKDWLGW
ncbi:MAG: hypothetical protein A3C10_02060 [Candidatus Magasanikbacteria bacterium RIFCSPHIGHO2_02_FULL_48_18]|nr:MAG: hypothetical protein A3I74_01165 [Candidatus Magasanikbacteria bacterium RIFCSPLOWO2_02_FULL_47_16]OGH79946.1 MAG: hypothetical protein A3C10_02060 [Candidatus Magasanikbacteria bacterium RIFCSPHIGHO2_02_FULL_48_18]